MYTGKKFVKIKKIINLNQMNILFDKNNCTYNNLSLKCIKN